MIKRSLRQLSFVYGLSLCMVLVLCTPSASEAASQKKGKAINDYIFPVGGGKWKGASKEIPGEITWDIAKAGDVRSNNVLRDWMPYNALAFTVESNRLLGFPKIRFVIGSKDKSYYSGYVRINFKGTKNVVIPFDEFGWSKAIMNLQLGSLDKSGLAAGTNPRLGLQRITDIQFTISGYRCGLWGRQERKGTVIKIRNLRLVKIPISKVGPRISDKQLFTEMLDLDYDGLGKVKSAVKKGDFKVARHELAEHIRRRKKPLWLAPNERLSTENTGFRKKPIKRIKAIMSHKFNVCHHRHIHDFGKHINWCVHPLSKGPNRTIEWNSMLNRHFHFSSLAHAYRKTGNEKYARELAQQINSFIRDCPVLLNGSGNLNAYHGPWVTLNTAIRYQNSWPDVIFDCLQSPEFTDDIIVNIVKSSAEHAQHLVENYTGHNWLTAEALAVYTIGTIFPEYKQAAAWRQFGITKLYNQLKNYVYPDGLMNELALGYNCWVLEEFSRVLQVADMNGRLAEIPADYERQIEKMFNYLMYDCMPDGKCFGLNDSWNTDVMFLLRKGYRLFPKRSDFLYPISAGKEGKRPKQDSIAMPYAGHYIMRSGWDKNARVLHFDGGLLGSGHYHEDKLHVAMYAYGKLLLPDAGTYSYNRSKWRAYVLKTYSHNTVLVDGMNQVRRLAAGRRFRVWPKPWTASAPATDTRWTTTHGLDYVVGFYRYKYREYTDWQHRKKHPKVLDTVQHARKILFVKPDFWIIHDVLTSKDNKKHTCDVLFHINVDEAKINPKTNAVTSSCKDAANVAIFPLNTGSLKVKIVEGKTDAPIQGWTRPGGKKHPDYPMNTIPTAIFNKTWRNGTDVVTVVYPFAAGAGCPVKSVTPIESKDGAVAAKITLTTGVEHVYLSNPKPGKMIKLAAIETDGEVAEACDQPGRNLRLLLVNGRSLATGEASVILGKRGTVSVTGYAPGLYHIGTDVAAQCAVKIPGLAKNAKVEIHKIDNNLNRTKKINATVAGSVIKFTTEAGGVYEIGIDGGNIPKKIKPG